MDRLGDWGMAEALDMWVDMGVNMGVDMGVVKAINPLVDHRWVVEFQLHVLISHCHFFHLMDKLSKELLMANESKDF